MKTSESTRIRVDGTRQITVDWRVVEYSQPYWSVRGLARMWQITRHSKTHSTATPLTDTFDIVTTGETIEGAARTLMLTAWTQCIEGKPPTDTEH